MKKNYIKMNTNKYLSLGSVVNIIKKVANNKNATQVEIFSCIFNVNNINNTTINNYLIGYRPIPIELKNIYINFSKDYKNNKLVYIDIVLSLINILENKIIIKNDKSLNEINNNVKLSNVINELINISKIDKNINKEFIDKIKNYNNYESIIELLNYSILNNIQPIYTQDINIKINENELNDYLKIKLYFGQSYINSLKNLKDNMYACAELGSLEYDGIISGKPNYDDSYKYYLIAANKNHPKACWMVAYLMLSGKVKMNEEIMNKYLNKSIKLGSAAGYNTLGLIYKKEGKLELAEKNFLKASELGYVYAFNNLGKLYEEEDNLEKAINYYKISADMKESWALNKVGEYYRIKGDYKTAFIYYSEAIKSPVNERCKYAYYNLAKFYYENGNNCVNIDIDKNKAESYYKLSGIKK